MKSKQIPRRFIQYILGLLTMALGIVLINRSNYGNGPVTALAAAISNVTPFSLGNTTTAVHLLCVLGQIIIVRRVTLKSILTAFVGIPFGYMIDGLMWLIDPGQLSIFLRWVFMFAGFAASGLGVCLVVGADLMLPAPDELGHTISQVYHKKLSNVKFFADAVYIVLAVPIDLIFTHRIVSVGIASVFSVLLTGRFVGWFFDLFPKLIMGPFWSIPDSVKDK